MRIEKLHIDSFMGTAERDIDFSLGVNILRGDNESGKSTVAEFIKFMLYGASARSESGDMAERLRFLSFGNSSFGGRMEITTAKGRFVIDRRIDRSTSGAFRESLTITDIDKKVQVYKGENAGEALLGIPEGIFKKVAYISQENEARTGGADLGSAIENLLFSADETVSTDKALKKLDMLRVSLLHKNGKGGLIYECAKEREELEARHQKALSENIEIIAKEGSLADTVNRIEENSAEHARCKKLCELYENYVAYTRFKKLDELENDIDRLSADKAELENKYEGFIPDGEYLGRLRQTAETLEAYDRSVTTARAKYENAVTARAAAEEGLTDGGDTTPLNEGAEKLSKTKRLSKIFTAAGIVSIAAGALTACAVYLMSFDAVFYGVAAAAAIIGTVLILLGLQSKNKLTSLLTTYGVSSEFELIEKAKEMSMTGTRSAEALARAKENESTALALLENEEKRYTEIKEAFAAEAKRIGQNGNEGAKLFAIVENYIAESGELSAREKILAAQREQLIKDTSAYNREEVEKLLAPVGELSVFEKVDIAEYHRKRDFLENAISALEIKKSELEKSLAALHATVEDPALLSATLEELGKKESAAKAKYAAAELAMRAIGNASEGLRTRISPRLAEYAGKLLSVMTDGKYSDIGVDSEMAMTFLKDGTAHDIAYLSKGTRESAYLALRLALADLICKEEKLPLILDECFAHADDNRTKQMLRVLLALAADDTQSIILTCHTREERIAGSLGVVNVIEM
ncbi:MAG: AAA family ATPase [Clostridia bacterium]|nr:AAA family ATPase [Clostridia bacterium]